MNEKLAKVLVGVVTFVVIGLVTFMYLFKGFVNIFKKRFQVVSLESIAKIKEGLIDPGLLKAKGLIKDKEKPVKILGNKELKSAVTVKAHAFSKQAAERIKKAGIEMSDTKFSNKIYGFRDKFSQQEVDIINEALNTNFEIN